MAKIPIGLSETTKLFTRKRVATTVSKCLRRLSLRSTFTKATPNMMQKTTTAGAVLLAKDLNGLLGTNSWTKSMPCCGSISCVLKNAPSFQVGSERDISATVKIATPHNTARTAIETVASFFPSVSDKRPMLEIRAKTM